MGTTRTQRLIRLLQMLQSGRKYDAGALADDLRISRRTLFRDLNMLSAAGVPYGYDKKSQRYSIAPDYFLAPINLTVEEAYGLMLSLRKLTVERVHPAYAQATEAAMKIEASLPARVRQRCAAVVDRIAVRPAPMCDVEAIRSEIDTIQRAMEQQHKLVVRYDAYTQNGDADRIIHPYSVAFIHNGWYLVGYCEKRRAVDLFKIDRIERLVIQPVRFAPQRHFDLDEYLGNAWRIARGNQRYHVKIRFAPEVADGVDEVIWHKTQRTQSLADGGLLFEADVDGLGEIASWVLGYGELAEVQAPDELRAMVRERAARTAALYAQPAG
ncbi:MAG TPA: YafY family protein [Phycisphaerae bacterium]|nr:YafY family transcriptional regulator [Phycisphaerales bacterium]HRX85067.1 YafY family protein [Phycisphaerae bacterium]